MFHWLTILLAAHFCALALVASIRAEHQLLVVLLRLAAMAAAPALHIRRLRYLRLLFHWCHCGLRLRLGRRRGQGRRWSGSGGRW